jgi:hypothetical protein
MRHAVGMPGKPLEGATSPTRAEFAKPTPVSRGLPGRGMFTAASMVDAPYPERDGYRQIDVKMRLVW